MKEGTTPVTFTVPALNPDGIIPVQGSLYPEEGTATGVKSLISGR
jgi:hypothetical protein